MIFWKRVGQAAYMLITKLKLSSKNLTIKFLTNTNGPTRCHIQKSQCVSQERCIYVYFVGKVVWSFFFQTNSSVLFCLVSIMKKRAFFLRLLTSVLCRFFFSLPYFQARHIHLLGEKSQKWATLLPLGYSNKGDGRNGSTICGSWPFTKSP